MKKLFAHLKHRKKDSVERERLIDWMEEWKEGGKKGGREGRRRER